MTNTALELAQHDKEIGTIVAGVQEEMEAFSRRMIELGKKEKSISPGVDAGLTARALLASLLGLLVLVRSRPDEVLLAVLLLVVLHRGQR
ncbi:MAG: hypothetical protein A3J97_04560 [Spirochaetes bacterium RIFOXYC1_FULL_54_7]|nr:MAG: hypothetical protein A3J97_04560 [Spirochaetes bacterium RIFOXYC1_FULL_54_7]